MPFLVILILSSLGFYVYLKLKYVRSKRPIEKQWLSAKSSIALGVFVLFFGINQWFIYQTTLSIIVGLLFVLIGAGSIWAGVRAYKHYLPFVIKEAQEQK
ncbi:YtpI family protein [Metabacillus iocasae]|uniref:Energy-converting hydrogenase Eha subunit A n=1 Tax=Priestia iocasae TaxID=2291674 RepID=A0ABS2QR41_9BACI|nr:YtpI family protein [Metabacillus iocasae]MBM7701221.1 energy-converting hydrogenase Eha subunit A [Metabacillus iocasae]